MAETLDFTILRGCDYRVRMRLVTPPDITELGTLSGWHVAFEVRRTRGGDTVLSIEGTLADIPRASELGVFDFILSAADTASLTERVTYVYAIRRSDTGFIDVFTKGQLNVESF